jgi:hypothetical protein
VDEIGEKCERILELDLSSTKVNAINLFFFPALQVLITTDILQFVVQNYRALRTTEKHTTIDFKAPPPNRRLHKYVGHTFKTNSQHSVFVDKIYETSKVTWSYSTPEKMYNKLLELEFIPPRAVLLSCIQSCDKQSVELLLRKGMNPNGPIKNNSYQDSAPLILSLSLQQYDIANSLLAYGADTYSSCAYKGSALHYANTIELARQCYHPVLLDTVDSNGCTALHTACRNQHMDVALFIIKKMSEKEVHVRSYYSHCSAFDYFAERLKSPERKFNVSTDTVRELVSRFIALGYPSSQLLPYALTPECVVHVLDAKARTLIPHKKLVLLKLIHVMGLPAHDLSELEASYKTTVKTAFSREGLGELHAFIKTNHRYFKMVHAGLLLVSVNAPLQL